MRQIGQWFTADTGVPVVVETPDEGPSKYQQAASAGKGPDIYIYAHDRIGEWVAGGLIHAVNPSKAIRQDIDPMAWQGFNWRGRYWGYPMSLECASLIYNKAIIPKPPESFEELFALDQRLALQGKKAIVWDYTNTYFTWALMAANGGYSYLRRDDGTFDIQNIGVDNAGALRGAKMLKRLLSEGLMPQGLGYPEMEAAMSQGRAGMMINGPWSWVNLKKAGIDFGVVPIPTLNGKAGVPFVGVKGLMINRATKQREVCVDFIENYVLSLKGLKMINRAEPIGAAASLRFQKELIIDPKIAGIMESVKRGVPTPAVPEIGRFWAAMKSSLLNMTESRQTPEQALSSAARQMREAQ